MCRNLPGATLVMASPITGGHIRSSIDDCMQGTLLPAMISMVNEFDEQVNRRPYPHRLFLHAYRLTFTTQ